MISHDDASELLGVYALDAVDGDERVSLEEHLATCPRCQAELDSLREVAGAMGNSAEPLPAGLWSSIADQMGDQRPQDELPPPMPPLTKSGPAPFRAPHPGRKRRARSTVLLLGAVAVAASTVAVVLGIDLVHSQDSVTNLQRSAAHRQVDAHGSAAAVALQTPGHRVVTLEDSGHANLAQFVIVPGGRGYLVSSRLPRLGHGETYQLWGIMKGTAISLGLLGAAPSGSTFTLAGANSTSKLAVTAEPNGGTVAPTGSILASGTV
ncbi:MAG TPA: anti-sigma factor [Acidimicrobiales bacterium]